MKRVVDLRNVSLWPGLNNIGPLERDDLVESCPLRAYNEVPSGSRGWLDRCRRSAKFFVQTLES